MDEAVWMKTGIRHELCFFHSISDVNACVYLCAQYLGTGINAMETECTAPVYPLVLKWSELVLMENQSICFNSLKIQHPILQTKIKKRNIQEPEENILWASGKNCF